MTGQAQEVPVSMILTEDPAPRAVRHSRRGRGEAAVIERRSLAQQVAEVVRGRIDSGDFPRGERLPAEKDLAVELGVSRTTLRDALQLLWNEGAIVRRHGVGTFVRDHDESVVSSLADITTSAERIRASGHEPTLVSFELVAEPAGDTVGPALNLDPTEPLWRLTRLFAADGVPAMYLVDRLPRVLDGRTLDLGVLRDVDTTMFDVIRAQTGSRIARMDGDLDAVTAGELAGPFGVEAGHPLLKMTQVALTDADRPVMHSENYNRPDVVRFRFVRRPPGA